MRWYAEATSGVIGEVAAAALEASPRAAAPKPHGHAPGTANDLRAAGADGPVPGCAAAGMLVGQVFGGRDQYSLMTWMARGRSICATSASGMPASCTSW